MKENASLVMLLGLLPTGKGGYDICGTKQFAFLVDCWHEANKHKPHDWKRCERLLEACALVSERKAEKGHVYKMAA